MAGGGRTVSRYVSAGRVSWLLSVAVVTSLILPSPQARAAGTIISVSNASGCSPTGAGGSPYCTISQAVGVVQPGQTIQVASGTYPESVTVNKAGTATAPIVLTTAPGASVTITGDGTSARALTVSAPYVQVNGFNVLSPTKQDVYVSASNVAVSNLSVSRTSSHGIYVSGSSGAPVSNVTLTGNVATVAGLPNIDYSSLAAGIYLKYATNSTVTMNTADADTLAGIYLGTGTANITVTGNVTFNNAAGRYSGNTHGLAPGIDTRSGPNLIIRNLSYSNEDSGLQFYTGAHDNVVTNNLSFNNGDHGIDDLNAPNQIIVGNTIYNNFTAGINLEGSSPGGTVENNLSVNNGLNSTRTTSNIRVDSTSISGAIVDYNDVRVPQQKVCGTNFTSTCTEYIWGKTGYSSLASFQAATGQEAHGKEADPLFMARDNGDFRLQAGSPAIDDANSAVAGWQATDYAANLRVDDPATPNTGVGPRSYDDRGALEYQPTQSGSPPTASLAVTPSSGIAPLAVTADASASTAGSAAIATYAFDFGDGSAVVGPQSGATTGHTYGSAGTYTAKVTVTDAAGQSSTATSQVAVTSSSPPTASLAVTPSSGIAPLAVTADASASTAGSAAIATYAFDFGDGSAVVGPQSGATTGHTYGSAGTYTAKVTVTDAAGQSSTATSQVAVTSSSPPTASLAVTPSSGIAPLAVTADASASTAGSAAIATYAFDFGDGSAVVGPQSGATTGHTYGSAGTYTAKVTVTDAAGQSSTATSQVAVTSSSPPNLVGNPGFETNTAGWNTSGSGSTVTLTRVSGGHSGGWSAALANTGTVSGTCALNDSPNWVTATAAGTYTGSLWVRADMPGAPLTLRFREYQGSTLVGSKTATVTLTTTWQQIQVTYMPLAPGLSTLDFNAYVPAAFAPPGSCFYADDAAITTG